LTEQLVTLRPARTVFPKTVKEVPVVPTKSTGLLVLKSAKSNFKLGGGKDMILKGPMRGMRCYALTLEERATCPNTCINWNRCYGNHMPYAYRYPAGQQLEEALTQDVQYLSENHPEGFVVRLHILGDFYSVEYVLHWMSLSAQFDNLYVFGYTHWQKDTPIGDAITDWVYALSPRVVIRRSDKAVADDPLPPANTVNVGEPPSKGTVFCPIEDGNRTASCMTCGLCMNPVTGITFIDRSNNGF